jgi:hypothetical protein
MAFAAVTANLYCLGALIHTGELAEIDRRLPAILDDAILRGDRFALTQIRGGVSSYACLARGDLEGARREARSAIDGWTRGHDPSTQTPLVLEGVIAQFFDVLARAQIHLYGGDARGAYVSADDGYRALRRSMLLRVQFVRVKMTELRARCALALSLDDAEARQMLLAVFDRDVAALQSEDAPWASALAELALATREAAYGSADEAERRFARAAAAADGVGMKLHAAIARVRGGGAEGVRADAWLQEQGVGTPARFVGTLSPHGG